MIRIMCLILICSGCCHQHSNYIVLFDHEYFGIDSRGVWSFYNITNSDGSIDGWIRLNGPISAREKMIQQNK